MKSEPIKAQIKFYERENGREGVDFLIGENQLYLQSIDLDTSTKKYKNKKTRFRRIKRQLVCCFSFNNRSRTEGFLSNSIKRFIASK